MAIGTWPAALPAAGPELPEEADLRSPEVRTTLLIKELLRTRGAPAISVAVARGQRIVFAGGFGFADLDHMAPATASTVYNIGSVSKLVTAVAVMQLLEAGAVDLDDPIRKYVPEFPDKGSPITLRHLLTHSGGLRHYRQEDFTHGILGRSAPPGTSMEEVVQVFKDDPLLFEPGTHYLYTSHGVDLLQGVVERAGGMPFEEYLIRHVWAPAGMLSTRFDLEGRIVPGRATGYLVEDGRPVPAPHENLALRLAAGGILSTVEDLARFAVAVNHGRLLKPETVELMLKPHLDPVLRYQEEGEPTEMRFRQALLWRVREDGAGRRFAYHCGTVKGFNACLVAYVEEDLVVVTADNAQTVGFGPALEIADYFRSAQDGAD